MTIAITGASGYIGTVLVPLLLGQGYSLRLLTRSSHPGVGADGRPGEASVRLPGERPEGSSGGPGGVLFVPGDLRDRESLSRLVSGADAVIHLAAVISIEDRPGEALLEVNVTGTRWLLEAARAAGVRRFLHLSSVTAYNQAPQDERLDEERDPAPVKQPGYDYSKVLSQAIALDFNGGGMDVLVLAPTAVLGPYDRKPSLIGQAILQLYAGKVPALFPGGVDFVDVRDVAAAIVTALTAGTPGKAYLLGGEWASLVTLSRLIGEARGRRAAPPVMPVWLIFSLLPLIKLWARLSGGPPFYTRRSVCNLIYSNKNIDHSRARAELNFRPRPLAESVRDAVEWFQTTGQLA